MRIHSLSPGRRIAVVALLVLAAAAAVLGVQAFRQKLASFQPLGFEAAALGDQWVVRRVGSPAPAALEPGDRIVLVNGVEAARVGELRRLLGANETAQLVVLRGEALETVAYQRPPLDADLPWLALAVVGALYLAIGLHSLWRTADGALFFAWCLASAVLYVFSPVFPIDRIGVWVYLGDELARLFLPPLTLHLFATIPRLPSERSRLRGLLYLPALVLTLVQLDLTLFAGSLLGLQPSASLLRALDRGEMLHLAAFAAAAIVVLARRLRTVTEWEQHRQLLWLVVGTASGYVPFLLLYGFPYLAGLHLAEPIAAVAVLPLACVPLAFGWSILRYRLWDLGLIVRNGAAQLLTVLLGVAAFALFDLGLRRALPDDESLPRDLLTFFGGVAIVGLVIPAHRRILGSFERLQYGSSFRRRRALAWSGRELLRERDLDRLCEALLSELEQGLDLRRANLLLVQASALVAVRPERTLPDLLPIATVPEHLWSGRFEVLSGVGLPGEPAGIDQRLYAAGYRYAFPLLVRDNRIGVLLTGLRRDDDPLDSEDVELVRGLLDQAALAIENAQLLDQVQRQLETVVALQRHSDGILESSPAGIAVLDAEESIVTANLAFAALAGRPRGEILGRTLSSILELGELPAPGGGVVQVACLDALERPRQLEVSVAPLQADQDFGRRVLVLQDVTKKVAMEGALKEKDRLAALGVLAAGVAHEVNTPLTGISSYAQLLLAETAADDPRRELLEKVEKQTFRASRIVSNLLEFARKPGVERHELDLGALLDETIDLLRERLSTRRVRLSWARPEPSIRVVGSAGELQQVFTNLMLNAIDAMAPQGCGQLTIELAVRAGGWVSVEVADDGPGIPPESRDSIFQPFFTTKRGQGGTGLGLSICYSIVQQHQGTIAFENLEPHGCRFRVELPAAPPAAVS